MSSPLRSDIRNADLGVSSSMRLKLALQLNKISHLLSLTTNGERYEVVSFV